MKFRKHTGYDVDLRHTLRRALMIADDRLPWRYILAILGVSLMGFFVLELWSEINEGDARAIDRAVLLGFRDPANANDLLGPDWFTQVMKDITTLGSPTVLALAVVASAGFMAARRSYRMAAIVLGASLSGSMLVVLFKDLFSRARPDVVARLVEETSMSFPSGHASNSAIIYLTITVLFIRVEKSLRTRVFAAVLGVLTVISIGISRLALGVHWPTDVLAGWLFGTVWAATWALVVKLPVVDEVIDQP